MKLLIVEDDTFKYSEIERLVMGELPEADIDRTENVRDTILYLNRSIPDLMVLDMSLPSHTAKIGEGNPLNMPNGGIEVILEIKILRHTSLPILILTQYPDIQIESEYFPTESAGEKIKEIYGIHNIAVSHFKADDDGWRKDAVGFLRRT